MASVADVANSFILLEEQNDGDGLTNLKLQKLVTTPKVFILRYLAPLCLMKELKHGLMAR